MKVTDICRLPSQSLEKLVEMCVSPEIRHTKVAPGETMLPNEEYRVKSDSSGCNVPCAP